MNHGNIIHYIDEQLSSKETHLLPLARWVGIYQTFHARKYTLTLCNESSIVKSLKEFNIYIRNISSMAICVG